MKKAANKQRGFGIVELLITLVAVGAILAAVVSRGNKADNKRVANETASTIGTLVNTVHAFRAQSGTFNGLNALEVNGMNVVSDPLVWTGTVINDPWGNPMAFTGNATGAQMTWAISIGGTVSPLDKEVCNILATILVKSADVVNIGTSTAVTNTAGVVGGGSVYKAKASATPDATALSTGCQAANPVIALQYH